MRMNQPVLENDQSQSAAVPVKEPYSLWGALIKEVSTNPFRSAFTLVQTVTIVIGVTSYCWSSLFPPGTEAMVPLFNVQKNNNQKYSADITFVGGFGVPVKEISGNFSSFDAEFHQIESHELRNISRPSQIMGQTAKISLEKMPEYIRFCLKTTNVGGVIERQRLVFELDDSEIGRMSLAVVGLFKPNEDEALSKKMVCD